MGCSGLHCGGCRPSSGGGGGVGLLLGAVVVGVLVVVSYGTADATVSGVAASAAAINQVLAWVAGIVVVLVVATGAGWVLLARRRRLRDAPIEAAFHAHSRAVLAAQERNALGLLPSGVDPLVRPVRVEAVRRDRPAGWSGR